MNETPLLPPGLTSRLMYFTHRIDCYSSLASSASNASPIAAGE
jgi:hypothetical protein